MPELVVGQRVVLGDAWTEPGTERLAGHYGKIVAIEAPCVPPCRNCPDDHSNIRVRITGHVDRGPIDLSALDTDGADEWFFPDELVAVD